MIPDMRILVSGAGIAGNAVAWLLARAGAHVVVLEKANHMLAQGQNVDIQGSALTAIKRMGLFEELKRYNTTEKGTFFVAPNGKHFAFFPQQKGSASFTNEFEILRGDLAQILYDKAVAEPNVEYRFATTVEKVLDNNEKLVKVQLSNGSVETYDLAIAADGQWSKLRRLVFPEEDITIVDKDAYCTYFTGQREPSDVDWWRIYHALRSRIISIRPDPHGTIRFCSTIMPCNDKQRQRWKDAMRQDRKTQEALIREEFSGAGWQTDRFLKSMSEATDFYVHGLQQIKMKQWFAGRVICIGDAGWAPTPLTGQGSTLAVTAAYLLAAELDALPGDANPIVALRAFDKLYHPHVDKMQDIPSFVPSVAHPESAFKRWILQTTIWAMSYIIAFPPIKNRLGTVDAEANDDGFPLPAYPQLDLKLV